jgi:hypothetical protein
VNDAIFVRTRYDYGSYADLWKLVELANFPTCYVDEIEADSGRVYIIPVRNGEWGDGWLDPKARIIHFNMEWSAYEPIRGVKETWTPDKWFASEIGAKYVPLGSDRRLALPGENGSEAPHYDIAYLGYMIPRRTQIAFELDQAGLSRSPTSVWGDERDVVLKHSTLYLHVHQHEDIPGVPALRTVVAAAYGLPFVTEKCTDCGILRRMFVEADYYELSEMAKHTLDGYADSRMRDYGTLLQMFLCDSLPFRQSIEAAL